VIRTKQWAPGHVPANATANANADLYADTDVAAKTESRLRNALTNGHGYADSDVGTKGTVPVVTHRYSQPVELTVYEVHIGPSTESIAQGLFAALRLLDGYGVDRIVVEGIDDLSENAELAAAVMNRVRKAAERRMTRT
jgi:hypothetical protein